MRNATRVLEDVSKAMRALLRKILPAGAYDALKRALPKARADSFRPSYDLDRLLRVLAASKPVDAPALPSGSTPALDAPAAHERRGAGHSAHALDLVVEHFARRQTPRFLFDASPLLRGEAEAAEDVERWIRLACDQVRTMTGTGLTVYGIPAPALRPGFPWGGEWCPGHQDVLFPARPHRFAFAPRLALAACANQYSAAEFTALLRDWMDFAARHPGLPFISTFVVTQRLIASSCALFFLLSARAAAPGANNEPCVALLQIIGEDIAFLIPRIGTSYPNGHLLTDCFAGWFIAALYPEFCRERIAGGQAESLWLEELERQTYGDGGSFEHAIHYHGLATELAVAYLLLKRRNEQPVSSVHVERIRNMLRIQADLAGPDGNAPGIGDATEDPMLPLDGASGSTAPAMREVYRRLFEPSIPALDPGHPANERAFWLLGDVRQASDHARGRRLSASPDAGLFVFFDDGESTRLVFRTGATAQARAFSGHMHSDLLSVCAVYRSIPILVDPGTYSYRWKTKHPDSPNWRGYLAGPLAHNGVVLDERDPLGPVTGDFRSGTARATIEHTNVVEGDGLSLVEARIASPPECAALVRGVVHVRGEYLLVYTRNAPADAAKVKFPLQLHHRAQVAGEAGHRIDLAGEDVKLPLVYSDELTLTERRSGSANPMGGWFSPAYGEIHPATQLLFRPCANTGVSAFALCLNPEAPPIRIASYDVGGSSLEFEISGAGFGDLVCVNSKPQTTTVSRCGVAFTGRLLWLRRVGSSQTAIRALDITSCRAPAQRIDLGFPASQREIAEVSPPRP